MMSFTVPGLDEGEASALIEDLSARLSSLIELQLILKHVHWNVAGPNFIAVHEMLDPQVDAVRGMTDAVAERIATLGGSPTGTPDAIGSSPDRIEYGLGRGSSADHLAALDSTFTIVAQKHREAIARVADIDPVTEGMLVDQLEQLELYQWFVRSHLESAEGSTRFGWADQPPTAEQSAAAENHETSDDTREAYEEMARIGANVEGEGRIS